MIPMWIWAVASCRHSLLCPFAWGFYKWASCLLSLLWWPYLCGPTLRPEYTGPPSTTKPCYSQPKAACYPSPTAMLLPVYCGWVERMPAASPHTFVLHFTLLPTNLLRTFRAVAGFIGPVPLWICCSMSTVQICFGSWRTCRTCKQINYTLQIILQMNVLAKTFIKKCFIHFLSFYTLATWLRTSSFPILLPHCRGLSQF